ncbi:MAG: Eco57I restriction-modification methylase domain-containing protein, partial [Nitrospinae bacterium]|nr:Eco57I restriction-modification methylase domain-containing protein [Nitrospinota bacterium]
GGSFDFVVGNPPYRRSNDGKINKDGEEAIACHEIKISLKDYMRACAKTVSDKGKVSIIYHPYRLSELMSEMRESKLRPSRIRFVHSNLASEAGMVMVEGIKGGNNDMVVLPPLYIYNGNGDYTGEMVGIYKKVGFEAVK